MTIKLTTNVGNIISHSEYPIKLPPNLGIVAVKRNGVAVPYLVSGGGNVNVYEPRGGAGWAGGVIEIEFTPVPIPDQSGMFG